MTRAMVVGCAVVSVVIKDCSQTPTDVLRWCRTGIVRAWPASRSRGQS
jgi:hypothetical protein